MIRKEKLQAHVSRLAFQALVATLLFAILSSLPANASGTVKKSESDICHSVESPYYERVKNFEPFVSVEKCLASGARLPRGMSEQADNAKAEATEKAERYDRDSFGGWADADGDCQDTRAELLIEHSTGQVRFASGKECRVVAGRWISMFTGDVIYDAGNVQIDHVVPVAYAWSRGAANWSKELKVQFYNDPRNLVVMESGLNSAKGPRGPTEWMPPAAECQYLARFARIVRIYELKLARSEASEIRNMLSECRA